MRKERILEKVTAALLPSVLEIEDESFRHQVPEGGETHFKLTIVSSEFTELNRVNRHKLLYQLLEEEWKLGLHALSLHLYTLEEWNALEKPPSQSPPCKKGHK